MIKDKLQKLGFSEKESEVYITLLKLGSSTVLKISKNCDIKRSTIYTILDSLEKKGLVRLELGNGSNKFVAEPPESLGHFINKQKHELSLLLPELQEIYNIDGIKESIKLYKGKGGIDRAYEYLLEKLKPSSDYLVFGNIQSWYDTNPAYFKQWPQKRKKIVRHGRSIFFSSPIAEEYKRLQSELETNIKIIPTKKEFNTIKLITSDLIFLHKTKKPYQVIIIENKDIVQMYKEMFEIMWDII